MILPIKNFQGNSPGEDLMWKKCKKFLSDEYVSFHNYYIAEIHQSDVIILVPNYGVMIIEIKSYKAKNIIQVPDRTMIMMKHGIPEISPFEQSINYRNALINEVRKVDSDLKKVYITSAVAYPYISEKDFFAKKLDKISSRRFTFLEEDLISKGNFMNKIDNIFTFVYEEISDKNLEKYSLDKVRLNRIGNLICPNFSNTTTKLESTLVPHLKQQKRESYSKLCYFGKNEILTITKINNIINEWLSGTKLWLYFANTDEYNRVLEQFKIFKDENGYSQIKAFQKTDVFFGLTSDVIELNTESLEVLNGDYLPEQEVLLNKLSRESNFNFEQYKLEHSNFEDMIVKAGAGTGKTYSLVSRINYLIWSKQYLPKELRESIIMITFTKDSAEKMKEKLIDNFMNMFIQTRKNVYLEYMSSAENMIISTIHSLSKKILQKFGSKLGYGKNIKVITGSYERSQIIHEVLNSYISVTPKLFENLKISNYHLEKKLLKLLDQFDNKNINIGEELGNINYGTVTPNSMNFIFDVLSETKCRIDRLAKDNNSILLGSIISSMRKIGRALSVEECQKFDIDFVFVDEFQDTDDVQIELLYMFKQLFDFEIFAVGDVKQCIYRFRGADEEAFDKLNSLLNENVNILSLRKNYRTDARVLNQFNRVFCNWDVSNDISYNGIDILKPTFKLDAEAQYCRVDYEDSNFEIKLVNLIKECLNDNLGTQGEVALLVRYNWQIDIIKSICEKHNISIETSIGGNLFQLDPSIDLLKLLKALKNSSSPEYLFSLYTTSYVNISLKKIDLTTISSNDLCKYFLDNLPPSLESWNHYLELLKKQPLLKVIRDIIDDVEPWDIFAQKIGGNNNKKVENKKFYMHNLDQLFENIVRSFNGEFLTLNGLVDYLELMIVTRQEEEEREIFSLPKGNKTKLICTTVHKSKGLEYDTVIMPFCNFDIESRRSKGDVDLFSIEDNDEHRVGFKVLDNTRNILISNNFYERYNLEEYKDRAKEETRILYVAMTRTIRRFFYFHKCTSSKNGKRWSWMIGGKDEDIDVY